MRRLGFGTLRTKQSHRLRTLDQHNLLGAVTLGWALVVGLTGVINAFADPLTDGSYIRERPMKTIHDSAKHASYLESAPFYIRCSLALRLCEPVPKPPPVRALVPHHQLRPCRLRCAFDPKPV
jgi:PepSY-associated TM region